VDSTGETDSCRSVDKIFSDFALETFPELYNQHHCQNYKGLIIILINLYRYCLLISQKPKRWSWVHRHQPRICAEGQIERVSSFKLLGLHLDADFSWQSHVEAVTSKATVLSKAVKAHWCPLCTTVMYTIIWL